jgi:hypothetical protein
MVDGDEFCDLCLDWGLGSCDLLQVQYAGEGGKGEDHRQKVLQR